MSRNVGRNLKKIRAIVITMALVAAVNMTFTFASNKAGNPVLPDAPRPKAGNPVLPDAPRPKAGNPVLPDAPRPKAGNPVLPDAPRP